MRDSPILKCQCGKTLTAKDPCPIVRGRPCFILIPAAKPKVDDWLEGGDTNDDMDFG